MYKFDSFSTYCFISEWVDPETREAAIKKAQAITDMIGYPAYIMEEDEHSLNNKYFNLTVLDDQYYNNTVKRNRFALTVSWQIGIFFFLFNVR